MNDTTNAIRAMNPAQMPTQGIDSGLPAPVPMDMDKRSAILELVQAFGKLTTTDEPYSTHYQRTTRARLLGERSVEDVIVAGESLIRSGQAAVGSIQALVIPADLPARDSATLCAWLHAAILHFLHRCQAAEADLALMRDLRRFDGHIDHVPIEEWAVYGPRIEECLHVGRKHSDLMADAMACCMESFSTLASRWNIPFQPVE